jgi:hypothetical protein
MADEQNIPLCACGCGKPVNVATRNDPKHGVVKGQLLRCLQGHHQRLIHPKRYKTATIAREGGSTLYHRQRAETALGHPLPPDAEIHHPNYDIWNPQAQLVICQDRSYHNLLHRRARVLRAGGNPDTDKVCTCCRKPKPASEFSSRATQCRPCTNANDRAKRAKERATRATVGANHGP